MLIRDDYVLKPLPLIDINQSLMSTKIESNKERGTFLIRLLHLVQYVWKLGEQKNIFIESSMKS